MFPLFKRGGGDGREKFYPVLRGGAQKVLDPRFSHFVAPLPVINDQSLTETLYPLQYVALVLGFIGLFIDIVNLSICMVCSTLSD